MIRPSTLVLAASLGILLSGCTVRRTTTEERSAYQTRAQERLEQLRAEIDSLTLKSAVASESLRVRTTERIEELKDQRDSAEVALDRMKTATGETWENTKIVTDRVLGALERSLGEARTHIHTRGDSIRP